MPVTSEVGSVAAPSTSVKISSVSTKKNLHRLDFDAAVLRTVQYVEDVLCSMRSVLLACQACSDIVKMSLTVPYTSGISG